jgi:hypothetical protein
MTMNYALHWSFASAMTWCKCCVLFALIWCLGACGQQVYEQKAEPVRLGPDTTMKQALNIMSDLTRHAPADRRVRFSLGSDCFLQVKFGALLHKDSVHIDLSLGEAQIEGTDEDKVFDVVFAYSNPPQREPQTVWPGVPFFEAHQMSWLINHIKRLCHAQQEAVA